MKNNYSFYTRMTSWLCNIARNLITFTGGLLRESTVIIIDPTYFYLPAGYPLEGLYICLNYASPVR